MAVVSCYGIFICRWVGQRILLRLDRQTRLCIACKPPESCQPDVDETIESSLRMIVCTNAYYAMHNPSFLPLAFKWKTLHGWNYVAGTLWHLYPQNWNTRHSSLCQFWPVHAISWEYESIRKNILAPLPLESLFKAPEIRFCHGLHLPLIRKGDIFLTMQFPSPEKNT